MAGGASPQPTAKASATRSPRKPSQPRKKTAKAGRMLLADYVAAGLAAVEPDTQAELITPGWARRTTGCSAGLSAKVAAGVRDRLTTTMPAVELSERTAA